MDGKSTPKSSSAGMAPRGRTQAASKEDMVVVCTKPGGKEALVQGKYTQAGNKAVMVEGKYTQLENKAAMVEGKYTQAGNRTGMGAETIIEKP